MEATIGENSKYFDSKNTFKYGNYDENRKEYYHVDSVKEINQHLNQTRSQRIRAALFPETLEDIGGGSNNHLVFKQLQNGKPTAVQRLSGPSQLLKTAVLNLINYQDDADATLKAVPELIRLLNDDDRVVSVKAMNIIEQLAKKDASRHALVNSQNLINALVNLINNCNDIEIQRAASSALYNLCCNQNGLLLLFKCGGIPALVKLLSSPIDSVVRYAISTLHNLLIYEETAKAQVRKCGGIQKFVTLLNHNDVKVLTIIIDCLHIISYNNAESKLIIAASGGPKELVRILRSTNYEKLIWTTIRLMKVLSVCNNNKPMLIQSGAMYALSEHLDRSVNNRIVLNCLLTIRNLSDCAIREENLDLLIKKLIEYLSSNTDANISICSAGILSNLTCNNDINKTKFVEYNGIEALVRTIVQSNENCDEIYEPAVCSLRHVTNRHSAAFKAQEAIRYNYGLPVIAHLLQSDSNRWPLIKASIGLVRNLALSENNLSSLRELGVIPRLVQLLIRAVNYCQKNGNNAIIDDVPMDEIIEGTVAAIHQLSRDPNNRVIIRELKVIPLIAQLLYMQSESIQKVATGCLCELANEKDSAELIENEHVTDKLTQLLRSKDEVIATYAAAVLFRLSENKPQNLNNQKDNSLDRMYSSIINNQNNYNEAYNIYSQNDLEMQQTRMNMNNNNNEMMINEANQMASFKASTKPNPQQQSTWFDTDL